MLEQYKSAIPSYAKDLKLNMSSVLSDPSSELTGTQIAGIALSCAYATHDKVLISVMGSFAENKLSDEAIKAVQGAASIMAMNNIYYRFVHMSQDKEFQTMPANLRMNIMANPGIDKVDFELYSLAVSALNGCELCISSHSSALTKAKVSKLAIQQTIRIAAVINGLAQVNAIE